MKSQKAKTQISTQVVCSSCVGVGGDFPYKHGNYCWVSGDYYLVNQWAENIQHMVNEGIIGKTMEAIVFEQDGNKYAFVDDPRIPDDSYHAPYFCGVKACIELLRWYHDIPDGECLCHDKSTVSFCRYHYAQDAKKRAIVNVETGRSILTHKEGNCRQCGKPFIKVGDVITEVKRND